MNIPKNCAECPYTSVCHAPHYGGSRCAFEKEIINAILEGGKRNADSKNLSKPRTL